MIASIGLCLLVVGFIVGKFENPLGALNSDYYNGCGAIGVFMKIAGLLAITASLSIWLWRNLP